MMREPKATNPLPLAGEGGERSEPGEGGCRLDNSTGSPPAPLHYESKGKARALRSTLTSAERKLWGLLRSRQIVRVKFRRQVPIGPYFADFLSYEARLVVEADGGQHGESKSDPVRDAWFAEKGFRVVRFWNSEILDNTEGVIAAIVAVLSEGSPSGTHPHPARCARDPLPQAGEG